MLLAAGQAFILLPFLAMDGESPTGKGGGGGICACLGSLLYAELPGKPGTKSALVKFTSEVCVR
jgi:hypothetical protein